MKRCPNCNRTYTDDTLSFCLEDGTRLLSVSDAPSSLDPGATIAFPTGRDTNQTAEVYRRDTLPTSQIGPPSGVSFPHMPPAQTVRKSNPLPWIIGGAVVLLFLGIGLIALIIGLARLGSDSNTPVASSNNANHSANVPNRNVNTKPANSNNTNASATSKNTNYGADSKPTLVDDFSTEKWWTGTNDSGTFWYNQGEYHMRAVAGRYAIVYGPKSSDYETKNATVRVTTHNVDGTSPSYGYGLVVHGGKENDQLKDYSFVIFTGDNPSYSVFLHQNGKETSLVKWTRSPLIKTGTKSNQLEVRVKDKQLSFYINGQYATSITDTANFTNGLAGFYTSDANEVAFDDLTIYR